MAHCIGFAASVSVCTAVVMTAPPAHADQYDFVSFLDNNGVYYDSILDVIDVGKAVCRTIRNGQSSFAVDQAIAGLTLNGYTSNAERAVIVVGAANTMCPDIWPAVRAHQQQVATEAQNSLPASSEPHPCSTPNPPAGCADGSY